MTALRIQGLHKTHGAVSVLRGIDLEIPDGSLTAVLGASGSGKTTLLRVIAGFERAQAGTVELGGKMLDNGSVWVAPERRGITFVSQDGSLFPHLNIAGNVGFGLPRGDRTPGRVRELLRLVGLDGLQKRYPHELSGGEQQRVSLARALAPRPRLMLLDEPFSALDETLRGSLRQEVLGVLKSTGTTAVLVTHDQDEALSLADKVAILRDGRIAQLDTPENLYRHPVSLDLAQFLGKANVVDAVIDGDRARCALGTLSLAVRTPGLEGSASVVIRPEQILVSDSGAGMPGIVQKAEYFGHDVILTVHPGEDCGAKELVVRIPGHSSLSVGNHVRMTAFGQVSAWKKEEPDPTRRGQ